MLYWVGLLVSVLAAFLIGRFYHRKPPNKSLTPYLKFSSGVLEGADEQVREELSVEYRGIEVDELHHLQFVIANDGDVPIRDYVQPLRLRIPDGETIYDLSILEARPDNLVVATDVEGRNLVFDFPLLNPGDWFEAKMLVDTRLDIGDLEFTILDEHLPATLEIEPLPSERAFSTRADTFAAVGSAVPFVALFIGTFAYLFSTGEVTENDPIWVAISSLGLPAFLEIVLMILAFVVGVVGGIYILGVLMVLGGKVGAFFGSKLEPNEVTSFPATYYPDREITGASPSSLPIFLPLPPGLR